MGMNMIHFGIFVCSLLIESTHAIVSERFRDCRDSFFHRTPPLVRSYPRLNMWETTDKCLCERYNGEYYFATYYDTLKKIPFYSAYKITRFQRDNEPDNADNKKRRWRTGAGLRRNEKPFIKDYNGVKANGLNRGHLATRFFFPSIDGRKATDVLTNIVLQYDLFNKFTWLSLEKSIFSASKDHCHNYGGESYFITGVLPSQNKPPFKGKIDIPSYVWTAVCCDTSSVQDFRNRFKGWSFAYIGENQNIRNNLIEIVPVKDFLMISGIREKYITLFEDISLFDVNTNSQRRVRNCLFDFDKAYQIMTYIVRANMQYRFFHKGLAPKYFT